MFYRDIVKKLVRRKRTNLEELATSVGLKGQAVLSQRLKDSWNPGMKDCQELLAKLDYEIVFAPKGLVQESKEAWEDFYVPEFPTKPEKSVSKISEK